MESNEQHYPLVTIGVTTYNNESVSFGREEAVRRGLDSLTSQDWPNLKIIIQDDCSNDSTIRILEEYSAKYSYVTIYRNKKNIGVIKNIETLLEKVDGEYFLWSCVDDYYCSDYISSCVKKLINFPEKIACQSYILMKNPESEVIFSYKEINIPSTLTENTKLKKLCLQPCYSDDCSALNPFIHGVQKVVHAKIIYNHSYLLYFEEIIPLLFVWMGGVCVVEKVLFENCAKKGFRERYPTSTFVKNQKNYLFLVCNMLKVLFLFIKLKLNGALKIKWGYLINTSFCLFGHFIRSYLLNSFFYKMKSFFFSILIDNFPLLIEYYRKIKNCNKRSSRCKK
jgi:glycosyltransferase involved in cell wall biosynthesis